MPHQEEKFPWDFDLPDDAFWQAIGWKEARMFHSCFSKDEISQMKLDPNLAQHDKFKLLLAEYEKKLAARQAEVSPKTLAEVDFDKWTSLKMGTASILAELGSNDEADTIFLEMVDTPDPSGKPKIAAMHSMAFRTAERGQYAEAEQLALKLLPVEESSPKLGSHSPQALSVLRLLIVTRYKQGKTELAKENFDRLLKLTEEAKGTKFKKYEADEQEQNAELVQNLGVDGWSV